METIVTAIIAAISAGAASGAKDVAKKAVVDGYSTLKAAIIKRFGEKSELAKAVSELELKPESKGRQTTLVEVVKSAGAEDDADIIAAAKALLETVEGQPGGAQYVQSARGNFIAQAAGNSTATVNVSGYKPEDD
jgi:hypothetical protein